MLARATYTPNLNSDENTPLEIKTDVSKTSVGAALNQIHETLAESLHFFSRNLQPVLVQ